MSKKMCFITYELGAQSDFLDTKSNTEIAKLVEEYVRGRLPWCKKLVKVSIVEERK